MPYKCDQCNVEFVLYRKFKVHLVVHFSKQLRKDLGFPTSPFTCPVCGSLFRDSHNLFIHFGFVHQELKKYTRIYNELGKGKNKIKSKKDQLNPGCLKGGGDREMEQSLRSGEMRVAADIVESWKEDSIVGVEDRIVSVGDNGSGEYDGDDSLGWLDSGMDDGGVAQDLMISGWKSDIVDHQLEDSSRTRPSIFDFPLLDGFGWNAYRKLNC